MSLEIFLSLSIGLVCLIFGGELLVRGASKLSALLGIPPMIIGLTVVAFGTSTPELAVSLQAALNSNADIAVANVVGSNIFNTLFILGISAIVSPLIIHSQMVSREVPLMIGFSILLWLFSMNGIIARWEGVVLFAGSVGYTGWLVFEALKNKQIVNELPQATKSSKALLVSLFFVAIGLGIIMLGADKLVEGAIAMAKTLGVSDAVIGLTIVAAGTSLPEVVASVMASLKGERDIAVGNVVGSNIYNILAILGITGAISPLNVNTNMIRFDIPLVIGISILMWLFFRKSHQFGRVGGGLFLALYVAYTVFLIQTASV